MGKPCTNCGKMFTNIGDFCRPMCEEAHKRKILGDPSRGAFDAVQKGPEKPEDRPQEVVEAAPGSTDVQEFCPTCGKRFRAMTPAERMRAYRKRLRDRDA